jgi:hypothetical protein
VHEGCLEHLAAVQRRRTNSERPGACYRTSLAGGSLLGASAPPCLAFLKANWLIGLNGIKGDALAGKASCASRLSASNRIIKISASIATTFGSKRPNSDVDTVYLSLLRTMTGSTTFAR